MKIAMFFRATRSRRTKATIIEMPRDWTVRDWADLPPHHPRSAN